MQDLPGFVHSFRVCPTENIKDFKQNSAKIGCEFFKNHLPLGEEIRVRKMKLWLLQWIRPRRAGWCRWVGKGYRKMGR